MPGISTVLALGLVDPARAGGDIAEAASLLPDINIFRAMANAPTLFPPFMRFLAELFHPLELDKALERIVVLHVARLADCSYAWRQNAVVARSVGVAEDQIAALERSDIGNDCFSVDQKLALRFAGEIVRDVAASEATTVAIRERFSDRALTELLFVIGTYMLVARIARTGRIPLDADTAPSPQ